MGKKFYKNSKFKSSKWLKGIKKIRTKKENNLTSPLNEWFLVKYKLFGSTYKEPTTAAAAAITAITINKVPFWLFVKDHNWLKYHSFPSNFPFKIFAIICRLLSIDKNIVLLT